MKFHTLDLDAFSNEKLMDNKLRSITGGHAMETNCDGPVDKQDYVDTQGETHYKDCSERDVACE